MRTRTDAKAIGRARTREERLRRHIYGDEGAKFSAGKYMVLLGGGNWLRHYPIVKR